MDKIKYRISLDMQSSVSQASLAAKQGDDNRQFCITLRSGGLPYGIERGSFAVLSTSLPGGEVIEDYCIIAGDEITYDFTPNLTSQVGVLDIEIRLYGPDGSLITSPTFILVVSSRAAVTEVVTSSSSFTALDKLYTDTNDLANRLSEGLENGDFDGVGIESIEQTTFSDEDEGVNEYTSTLTNGLTSIFRVKNGSKGSKGDRGESGKDGADYDILANAVKQFVSGNVVTTKDVSPIKHTLTVKAIPIPMFVTYSSLYAQVDFSETLTENGVDVPTKDYFTIYDELKFFDKCRKEGVSFETKGEYTFAIGCSHDLPTGVTTNAVYFNGVLVKDGISPQSLKSDWGVEFLYISANIIDCYVKLVLINAQPAIEDELYVSGKNFYDNSTIADKKDFSAPSGSYSKYTIPLPNGTYTWSLKENTFFGSGYYVVFSDDIAFSGATTPADCIKEWVGHSGVQSLCPTSGTFKVTRGFVYLAVGGSLTPAILAKLATMQIELGSATEYEPFREPSSYPIKADGTVEGVTSIYPATVLYTKNQTALIDVEYNADTKKYIDNQIKIKIAELTALVLEN